MTSATKPVESLLEAVKQLSPEEFSEFAASLTAWQKSADDAPAEAKLVRQIRQASSHTNARRLAILAVQSERGDLTPTGLDEYRQLAARSERISASRVLALADLARLRKQSIHKVKQEVGWQEEEHGG